MQLSSIQVTLTSVLASFFEGATVSCWLMGNQQTYYMNNEVTKSCSIEETVVLKKLFTAAKSSDTPVFKSSILNCFHPELGSAIFHTLQLVTGETLIIAGNQPVTLITVFERVLNSQLTDLMKRQHILRLIDNESTKNTALVSELNTLRTHRKNELLLLTNQWINKQQPVRVFIDQSFFQKIDLLSSNDALIQQLDTAFELIRYLQPGLLEYHLNDSYFSSTESIQQIANERFQSSTTTIRNRAELLLDKYEQAALSALASEQVINGKTIAAHLQPSVSPPAITDALKKNRKAIKKLLDENPNKWGLLRSNLKPVKNISEASFYSLQVGIN